MTDSTGPFQPGAPPSILLVVGEGRVRTIPLGGQALVIGRGGDCDVQIDHTAFSRRHAILHVQPRISIQDLDSKNGVLIGKAVSRGGAPIALAPGEGFAIGPFAFILVASRSDERSTDVTGRDRIVVEDPTPERVSSLVHEIAASGFHVVIQGETGSGKDVLAHTLHELSRRAGPIASINCATLSEQLLESELFGFEKGAFTGAAAAKPGLLEVADRGTVFLDEIGELPLGLQAKLLRAVESREIRRIGATRPTQIDVRILAATHRELVAEVAAGRFRQDLFYRLDGVTLWIPPLRERKHAIAPLALRFIAEAAARLDRGAVAASPEFLVALEEHAWPGNVRELRAVIDRAVLLARRDGELGRRHVKLSVASPASPVEVDGDVPDLTPAERRERAAMIAALAEEDGNQTRAAKRVDMARSTFVQKLKLFRIPRR